MYRAFSRRRPARSSLGLREFGRIPSTRLRDFELSALVCAVSTICDVTASGTDAGPRPPTREFAGDGETGSGAVHTALTSTQPAKKVRDANRATLFNRYLNCLRHLIGCWNERRRLSHLQELDSSRERPGARCRICLRLPNSSTSNYRTLARVLLDSPRCTSSSRLESPTSSRNRSVRLDAGRCQEALGNVR